MYAMRCPTALSSLVPLSFVIFCLSGGWAKMRTREVYLQHAWAFVCNIVERNP